MVRGWWMVLVLGLVPAGVFGQAPTHKLVFQRYEVLVRTQCAGAGGLVDTRTTQTTPKVTGSKTCVDSVNAAVTATTVAELTLAFPQEVMGTWKDGGAGVGQFTPSAPFTSDATLKADFTVPTARGYAMGIQTGESACANVSDLSFNSPFTGTRSLTKSVNGCVRNVTTLPPDGTTFFRTSASAQSYQTQNADPMANSALSPPSVGFEVDAYYKLEALPADDLMVTHVHPVQAIQTPQEHVTLIGGKKTVVRVFIKSIGANARDIPDVTAVLRCEASNGVRHRAQTGLRATARKLAAPPPEGTPPPLAETSVYLVVPPACTKAGTAPQLEVEVIPPDGVQDLNPANNTLTRTVVFAEPPKSTPLRIGYMRIWYQPPGAPNRTRPADRGVNRVDEFLRLTYPVPENGVRYFPLTVDYPTWTKRLITGDEWDALLRDMAVTLELMDLPEGEDFDQVVGWIPHIAGAELGGVADARWYGGAGRATIIYSAGEPFNSRTLAHEVGHNLGIRHTNERVTPAGCPVKAVDSESAWPFDGPQIQTYGFNYPAGSQVAPGLFDFMSYCPRENQWVSPYTFEALIASGLEPRGGLPPQIVFGGLRLAAEERPTPRRVSQDVWVVSGSARRDGSSGKLDSFLRVRSSRPVAEAEAGGTHCLQFSGSGGALGSHCFAIAFRDADGNVVDERSFVRLIPVVEGATRVALVSGGTELATLSAGGAVNVTITSPQAGDRWDGGGARAITWSSNAGAGARYAVQYSSDGGTSWQALAGNLAATELTVDPTQLQGGENIRFRVLAGAGLNTASAEVGPMAIVQAPRLEVPSGTLELHNAVVTQGVVRTFEIRNPGTGPLRISAITPSGEELELVSPGLPGIVPAGEALAVTVRFVPSAVGEYAGTLRFASNDAASPAVVLNVRGRGITAESAEIAVSPAAVAFGNVAVGGNETRELTVQNYGPGQLSIASAQVTGPFTVVGFAGPVTVDVNASLKLMVRFTPTGAGAAAGTLTLNSNDPVRAALAVGLTGTGLAADDARLPKPGLGGVVHGASFTPALARGTLASVFGTNLANGTVAVSAAPWPVSLGGTQVIIGGIAAPLYFVSAGQINFQVPFEAPLGQVTVFVVRDGFVSVSQVVTITENAPGVFTYARTAQALDPIVIHANGQLVTPDNPAVAGEIVILFLTGIGTLTVQPVTGDIAPFDALAQSSVTPVVTLGGSPVEVLFAGLSPGFIGLGQMNLKLPAVLPTGNSLEIGIGGGKAVTVTLAVR